MPQIEVTVTHGDQIFLLKVDGDLKMEDFKGLCEAETNVPVADILLLHHGKAVQDDKKVSEAGIVNGDMVLMERRMKKPAAAAGGGGAPMPDFGAISVPQPSTSRAARKEDDPAFIREMLRKNPDQLAMLRQNNTKLAEAFDSGNLETFAKVLKEQYEARAERERQRLRMMTADPFDMEAQKLIAQEIENKNIDQNMELAMEYNPESFGTVIMLYINCKVNGHPIKAFVDSGAQATIMSQVWKLAIFIISHCQNIFPIFQAAAERCGIMRLVDRRWEGIAKGVGTQKIIGRVHLAQVQIEKTFLSCSFSILEQQPMDMLLGLDMLKRHQCVLDLRNNKLIIGTDGNETSFLSEADLPPCARLSGAVSCSIILKHS